MIAALVLALLVGDLLVEIPAQGTAIVRAGGGHRVLGEWYDADWSPDGTRIAAVAGETLAALGDDGRVRWRVRGDGPVAGPRWAPDGMKVAYRRGGRLRVVEADGGGDRRLARGLGFAGPQWQPGKGYAVAWADRDGRVRLRDALTGRTLWRTAPGAPVRGLAWSRTGTTVAAWSGTSARVLDGGTGRVLRTIRARGTNRFEAAAFLSSRLLLVRHDIVHGGSRVLSFAARRPGVRPRRLFAGGGRIVDLTPSPDHESVLLGWRGGDEWRVLGRDERRLRRVTRRFTPGAGRWAFPTVRAWREAAGDRGRQTRRSSTSISSLRTVSETERSSVCVSLSSRTRSFAEAARVAAAGEPARPSSEPVDRGELSTASGGRAARSESATSTSRPT